MRRESFLTGKFPDAPPVDVAIARVAAQQHAVLRGAQLRAAGLSASAITKRVAAGRLWRRYRDVYSLGPLSREGEFLAAVFSAGLGAMLSHDAAAELLEVRRYRASLIDVVAPSRRVGAAGVRIHWARNLDPRDVTWVNGIPVSTIPRLLIDLSDHRTDGELANVIHEAAFRNLFNLDLTLAAMARANGRRNLNVLRRAIAYHLAGSAGTKSRPERAFLAEIRAAGLSEPLPNVQLQGFEVDFLWADAKLVVEVDGPGHKRPRTQVEDERRDRVLRAAGFNVIRLTA